MVQTGRNRYGAVSFVSASIQHDARLEAQTRAEPGTDRKIKTSRSVIKKLLNDKEERH
jgi:hypothetical protein